MEIYTVPYGYGKLIRENRPRDWVDAAYARFRDEGFDGLRVEALARDLGATKGSFYWHFADRAALVTAVMERWEREETDAFIRAGRPGSRPRARLEVLFRAVGRRQMPGEHRLYADAVAEGVGPVVKRVTAAASRTSPRRSSTSGSSATRHDGVPSPRSPSCSASSSCAAAAPAPSSARVAS